MLAAAAILDFFKVPVVLFVRHLWMLESLKNFENFTTFDTQAADIRTNFWLRTNLGELM